MASLKYLATLGTGFQKTTISNGGAGYTSGATSIVVADGSVFPATGDFYVGVGNSDPPDFIKICTARVGNTLTVAAGVVAGADGNKADGVAVQWVLPPEGLDQLRQDQSQTGAIASAVAEKAGNLYLPSDAPYLLRDTGAAFGYWGPLLKLTKPPAATTGFSFVNERLNVAVTPTVGTWHITIDGNGTQQYTAFTDALAGSTYTVEVRLVGNRRVDPTASLWGICIADGQLTTSKYILFGFGQAVHGPFVQYNSQLNTFDSTLLAVVPWLDLEGFKIVEDVTNRTFYVTTHGNPNWVQVFQHAHNTSLTASHWGFFVYNPNAAPNFSGTVLSLIES